MILLKEAIYLEHTGLAVVPWSLEAPLVLLSRKENSKHAGKRREFCCGAGKPPSKKHPPPLSMAFPWIWLARSHWLTCLWESEERRGTARAKPAVHYTTPHLTPKSRESPLALTTATTTHNTALHVARCDGHRGVWSQKAPVLPPTIYITIESFLWKLEGRRKEERPPCSFFSSS